jgi:hypothetical protein
VRVRLLIILYGEGDAAGQVVQILTAREYHVSEEIARQ